MRYALLGSDPVPNLPWEERPAGCSDVLWRASANPIRIRFFPPGEIRFRLITLKTKPAIS